MLVRTILVAVTLVPSIASAQVSWRGDFETGDTTQYNYLLNPMIEDRVYLDVVSDRVAEGAYSARIELHNDAVWSNGLKRVELQHSPDRARTAEGEELFFAWSFYLPEVLPSDPEQQIGYWETNSSYQQMMSFAVAGERITFSTRRPVNRERWRGDGAATAGVWHRIAMRIVWSTDETIGRVDVWFDGEQVVADADAMTLADANPTFVQMGLLRGRIEFADVPVIYIDDAIEGASLEDVRYDAVGPMTDAGVDLDAGSTPQDAGEVDAAGFDAGPRRDGGTTPTRDAGTTSEPVDGGCDCATADSSSVAFLALLFLALSRRRA